MLPAIVLSVAAVLPAADRPQVDIATSMGVIRAELFSDQCPRTVETFTGLAQGTLAWKDASAQEQRRPYYDGLTFHRVIKGFMIQGGCPKGDGTGGPGFAFPDEINAGSLGLDREPALVSGDQLNPQCAYMARDFFRVVLWPKMQAKGLTEASTRQQREAVLPAVLAEAKTVTLKQFYEGMGYAYRDDLPASTRPQRGCLAMANSGPGTNGSQFFINLGDTPHLTGKHTVFGRVVQGMEVVDAIGGVATGPADRPAAPVTILSIRIVGAAGPATAGAAR